MYDASIQVIACLAPPEGLPCGESESQAQLSPWHGKGPPFLGARAYTGAHGRAET